MKKKSDGAEVLLASVIKGIFEKKGQNVLKIDLRKLETQNCRLFCDMSCFFQYTGKRYL